MRFFFHQRTRDGWLEDPDGTELPRLSDAIAEALQSARHLWADAIIGQRDLIGESFAIAAESGNDLATIDFVDALPPSLRPTG